MKTAPVADVAARLSDYIDECEREGPVAITRNGKAVAVLLCPVDEDDLEGLLLARSPRFQELLERSRRSIREGKGLTLDEVWQELGEREQRKERDGKPPSKHKSKVKRRTRKQP